MNRIMIIGPSGSGKSTLAERLGEILSLPHYHLDCLHFESGWKEVADDIFYQRHEEVIDKERWVLDGNYRGSTNLDKRMARADTLIMIDFSTTMSLYNVIMRRIKYHNKTRPSIPEGCNEKIDLEFLKWVLDTGKRRPSYLRIVDAMRTMDKEVLIFKNRRQVNAYLKKLRASQ